MMIRGFPEEMMTPNAAGFEQLYNWFISSKDKRAKGEVLVISEKGECARS